MVEKHDSKSEETPETEPAATPEGSSQWEEPSRAPGFEGATPQALARALFRPVKR